MTETKKLQDREGGTGHEVGRTGQYLWRSEPDGKLSERRPSHGRAKTCHGGLCPLPDIQAADAWAARPITNWIGYEDGSDGSEIGRGSDGRSGSIMGVTERFPYFAPKEVPSATPACGTVDEARTISAAAATLVFVSLSFDIVAAFGNSGPLSQAGVGG
jgi:hypothetical protein